MQLHYSTDFFFSSLSQQKKAKPAKDVKQEKPGASGKGKGRGKGKAKN